MRKIFFDDAWKENFSGKEKKTEKTQSLVKKALRRYRSGYQRKIGSMYEWKTWIDGDTILLSLVVSCEMLAGFKLDKAFSKSTNQTQACGGFELK